MEISNTKKIVVLKNLPSNLVEEAIVVMKDKSLEKRFEFTNDKMGNGEQVNKIERTKDYAVKEAEMLISSYISSLEDKKKSRNSSNLITQKYKRIKKASIILLALLVISVIINLV